MLSKINKGLVLRTMELWGDFAQENYIIRFFFNERRRILFIHLFLFSICLRWVFLVVLGLSLVVASGDDSSLRCIGFAPWCLLLLRSTGSRAHGFQQWRLTGARAQAQ